ncbi:hypothetical protein HanPSC8_Chr05g0191881 [Helianthus annuus]|nr:hypothetical protein HanPSC8_Chr05g0191881 [Helianthus annuus]
MCLMSSSISMVFCFWSKFEGDGDGDGDDSISGTFFTTLDRNFSNSNLYRNVARFDEGSPMLLLLVFFQQNFTSELRNNRT